MSLKTTRTLADAQLFKTAFESAQESNAALGSSSEEAAASTSAVPQAGAAHVEPETKTAADVESATATKEADAADSSSIVHGDTVSALPSTPLCPLAHIGVVFSSVEGR